MTELVEVIRKKTGLDFSNYGEKSLKRRIVSSSNTLGLKSVAQLRDKITKDDQFIHQLVNLLSVGLTTMFRDPELWVRLRPELKEMAERKKKIRVWHAGCSTGEEVFTLNIILEELGVRESFRGVATDMNEDSLETAKKGLYSHEVIKEYNQQYTLYKRRGFLDKYYQQADDSVQMDLRLTENVKFRKNNLISETMNEKFDLILCRNVMIYFDTIAKKALLEKFHKNLMTNGLLVTGYHDSIVPILDPDLYEVKDMKHRIFAKKGI